MNPGDRNGRNPQAPAFRWLSRSHAAGHAHGAGALGAQLDNARFAGGTHQYLTKRPPSCYCTERSCALGWIFLLRNEIGLESALMGAAVLLYGHQGLGGALARQQPVAL